MRAFSNSANSANSGADSNSRLSTKIESAPDFDANFQRLILDRSARALTQPDHFSGEKLVASMNTELVFSTIGPFASEAAFADFQSVSLRNASQFFCAASRLGCARIYMSVFFASGASSGVQ